MNGRVSTLIKKERYRKFYMHRTGHWLGMDVHDVGDYKISGEWRVFEPGMVVTVEPGLYITGGDKTVPKRCGTSAFESRTTFSLRAPIPRF